MLFPSESPSKPWINLDLTFHRGRERYVQHGKPRFGRRHHHKKNQKQHTIENKKNKKNIIKNTKNIKNKLIFFPKSLPRRIVSANPRCPTEGGPRFWSATENATLTKVAFWKGNGTPLFQGNLPGPSKGCQMVPKGCQFTIRLDLIGTLWKVLVGWWNIMIWRECFKLF